MKLLKINSLFSNNFLQLWNKNFRLTSFTNIFSLLINSLSVAIIILIFSINDGFKQNAVTVLNLISGNTKIYHSYNISLSDDDYQDLLTKYKDNSFSRVTQDKCVVKHNGYSESILLNSYNLEEDRYSDISNFIYKGSLIKGSVVLGKLLAEKLNAKIGDKVSIIYFNNYETQNNNKLKVKDFVVSGLFATNFMNFDSNVVFTSIETDSKYSYFTSDISKKKINNYKKYNCFDVNDMYPSFISWINSYDNPLKILILFILVICTINIIHNNYYLIHDKSKQLFILRTLGLKNKQLRKIIFIRSLLLAILSIIIGSIFAYLFFISITSFNIVQIPEYVYFTNSIPIHLNFQVLYILLPYFILLIFSSLFLKYKNEYL